MRIIRCPASYYQQFDADFSLSVPGEGYGGWRKDEIALDLDRTAVVSMHAWDCGTPEQFPGWHRAVEYLSRADEIVRTVFPPLLGAVRRSGVRLFHVVGGGKYYQQLAGYRRVAALAGAEPAAEWIPADATTAKLNEFRAKRVFVGEHNQKDVAAGFGRLDFPAEARPVGDEAVAENSHQLFALCKNEGVNHLIYVGFAINWCLLMSPGGMLDMRRRGLMCSTIRQATTAVENKETARQELNKQEALWRVALNFGFVFDLSNLLKAIEP